MRSVEERRFVLRDGTGLFYRYWPGAEKKAIVLLHRGHEHSGRLAHVAEELNLPEFAVFAAAWVHDYAPQIRCLVLASPASVCQSGTPSSATFSSSRM